MKTGIHAGSFTWSGEWDVSVLKKSLQWRREREKYRSFNESSPATGATQQEYKRLNRNQFLK